MQVLFSAAVIACPLQTTYFPGSDSLILDTKTVHSKEDEGKLQSWTKAGILLNFWGVFQFTHILPLPSPHRQRWTHVAEFFPQFQLCIGWGRENYKKISKWMNCFMIACVQKNFFSPQIFTEERREGGQVCTQAILWGSPEIRGSYEYYHEYWNYKYFPEDFCPGL